MGNCTRFSDVFLPDGGKQVEGLREIDLDLQGQALFDIFPSCASRFVKDLYTELLHIEKMEAKSCCAEQQSLARSTTEHSISSNKWRCAAYTTVGCSVMECEFKKLRSCHEVKSLWCLLTQKRRARTNLFELVNNNTVAVKNPES